MGEPSAFEMAEAHTRGEEIGLHFDVGAGLSLIALLQIALGEPGLPAVARKMGEDILESVALQAPVLAHYALETVGLRNG